MQIEEYLSENGVEVRDYEAVFQDVGDLASEENSAVKKTLQNKPTEGIAVDESHRNGHQTVEIAANPEPKVVDDLEDLTKDNNGVNGEQFSLIWIDPATCSYSVYSRLPAGRVLLQQSPLTLAKALKVNKYSGFLFVKCVYVSCLLHQLSSSTCDKLVALLVSSLDSERFCHYLITLLKKTYHPCLLLFY